MNFFGYNNLYYWFKSKLTNLRYLPREIKWKIQRMKRGYSTCDIWGFDYYLTDVILGGLKYLRKNKNGTPKVLPYDEKIHPNDIDWKAEQLEWDRILDTIIYAFEIEKHILDDNWWYISSKNFTKKEYNERVKQFEPDFHVMTLKESQKFEEGWFNFQKYFHSLWD